MTRDCVAGPRHVAADSLGAPLRCASRYIRPLARGAARFPILPRGRKGGARPASFLESPAIAGRRSPASGTARPPLSRSGSLAGARWGCPLSVDSGSAGARAVSLTSSFPCPHSSAPVAEGYGPQLWETAPCPIVLVPRPRNRRSFRSEPLRQARRMKSRGRGRRTRTRTTEERRGLHQDRGPCSDARLQGPLRCAKMPLSASRLVTAG